MKKLVFAMIALLAMGVMSCRLVGKGEKSAQDSTKQDTTVVDSAAVDSDSVAVDSLAK